MERYTQGSILYGLRSQYYEGIKCYGVIITARCEIAQNKAKIIHLLSAVSLHDWVCTELFSRAFSDYLHNDILGPIQQWAKESGLDFGTLIEFGPEKVRVNINADANLKEKTRKKIDESIEKWIEWNKLSAHCPMHEKVRLLDDVLSKKKSIILKELLSERFPNEFCFLPHKARLGKNEIMTDGIVVNLKDIISIPPKEIDEIEKYGFEYSEIIKLENGNMELEKLNSRYFLESDDDFVIFDGQIDSPWIEHLLQNFSSAFARIGVETLSNKDLCTFCDTYCVSNQGDMK